MSILKIALNLKVISNWPKSDSLTKKASLNAIASAIDYAARVAVEFVINPLLLAGLGDYLYGVWRVVWGLIGYMWAAGGRSAQALKWAVANKQASTDYDEKRRYVGSALAVGLLFLPILIVLGLLLVWVIPVRLGVSDELVGSVRLTIGLLVINAVGLNFTDIPRGILQGENLGYKRMGLSAVLILGGGGLMVLSLRMGLGIAGLAAANIVLTILTGLLFLRVVRSEVTWVGITWPNSKMVRWFFSLSWWLIVWKFVMQFMMSGDVVVLGLFDSPEQVTVYSFTKYLPEALTRLVALFVFGITPGLGGIIGSGEMEKAVRVRNEIMAFTWLLITVIGSTMLLWNRSFVQLWVGPQYDAGLLPTILIILLVAQIVLIRNDSNIIDMTLNVRRKVLLGVLSVFLSIFLAKGFINNIENGIVGLVLGFIIGRLILTVLYPWQVGRYLGVSIISQFKGIIRPFVTTLLIFALMIIIREYVLATTWINLVFSAGASVLVMFAVAVFTGLDSDQRRLILKRVRILAQIGKTK